MRCQLRHAVWLALLLGSFMNCMACAVPGPHTNEELVREAESIVLAKVAAGMLEHFGGSPHFSVSSMSPTPGVCAAVFSTSSPSASILGLTAVG